MFVFLFKNDSSEYTRLVFFKFILFYFKNKWIQYVPSSIIVFIEGWIGLRPVFFCFNGWIVFQDQLIQDTTWYETRITE